MPRESQATLSFNRGVLSQLGLARIDIARYRMAAALMVNWMARVLGSMMLRPGTAYLTSTLYNQQARTIPFIFGASDTARIEVTQGNLRVLVNDALVARVAVGTAVTNGNFPTNLSGWTNNSEAGASVSWLSAGQVGFDGTGTGNNAILDQQVTVAAADQGKRHALRIVVTRGPFIFRCGTSLGDDGLINETTLYAGTHSLAFTPTGGSFWIRFQNPNQNASILATVNIEAAGVLTLPAPWQATDFQSLRWVQSADVIFVGCAGGPTGAGYAQQQIERRATDSWSIVGYPSFKGPFRPINISNITLAASAISGDITLTASRPLFNSGHVGALFRLISVGQLINAALSAGNTFSNPILVTGVGSQRTLPITITGTWVGTLTLQYSVGAPGTWVDVKNYGSNGTDNYADGLDNQTVYYRVGFKTGNYTSGTANIAMSISQGSITGRVVITAVTDNQHASAAVLQALGGTAATTLWYEGAWSTFRGFPGVPMFFQGRLWWFGTGVFGSVSDDYTNFDDTTIGAAAPIIGQFDSGPVDNIYWAIALQQLVAGTASQETSIRSTYLGDPVTPTNFNVMTGSTQGSANVAAIQMDRSGVFVQISGSRVFSLDLDIYTYSYRSNELTQLVPDYNAAGIIQLAIQRKPDTRIHCLRADGTVGIMVYDPAENVTCWLSFAAANGGFVEDISVLPGAGRTEDQVYYLVRRTVNGYTFRYHEKWALESECTGLPVSKCLDSHVVFTSTTPTATLTGIAPHLVGQTVSVWGWNTSSPYIDGNGNRPGLDLGTYVVDNTGSIAGLNLAGVSYPVTNAIVGLPYTAQWQSMKQSFAAALGTPLNQPKRISRLGLILQNTHGQGLRLGVDFSNLDDLPLDDLPRTSLAANAPSDTNAILNNYDHQMFALDDIWSTDSRVSLQATSPRPVTCLAFTAEMETSG